MSRYSTLLGRLSLLTVFAALIAFVPTHSAFALIFGGEGNKPVDDPGWPAGTPIVFNQPVRIAYWEGPPFGGGQWHSECRGDANAFNAVLTHFAKMDAKTKRLVIHDGVGHSLWINPNNEALKSAAAQMDWIFMVWQSANWQQLAKLPPNLKPADIGDAKTGPPTQIDVYTGGHIHWADVVIPAGLEVIDERLEVHGGSVAEGSILEGTITDLDTNKPIAGSVQLQYIETDAKGVSHVVASLKTSADEKGHWLTKLRIIQIGTWRVVLSADGFVPRIISQAHYDGQPGWHNFKGGLARATKVAGHVADDAGHPLPGVEVKLIDFVNHDERYDSREKYQTTTDADGHFHFDGVPTASANVMLHKNGYVLPGLGPTIKTPATDVALTMKQAAQMQVTVDFTGSKRSESYIVEMEPEGGNVVGSWGGSSQIDEKNQVTFRNVPPGHYFLQGHPNPHQDSDLSKRIPIELKGGGSEEIKLPALNKN